MRSAIHLFSRWSPLLANKAYETALVAYRRRDYGAALATFKVLAGLKYPEVQALLARMYLNGEGVTVDRVKAAKWFLEAAESGHAEAAFAVGLIYEDGIEFPKDISKALHWYRLSAQQGFAGAQVNLAHCFHRSLGVDQDDGLAAWWVRRAAEQGDIDAQLNLGVRYLQGVGIDKSESDAFFWLDLAAKAGNSAAATERANLARRMPQNELIALERRCLEYGWRPKSTSDSAFEIFAFACRQTTELLIQTLGDDRFAALRLTTKKWPRLGKLIVSEIRGYTLPAIATNLEIYLTKLDRLLDLKFGSETETSDRHNLPTVENIFWFIRRLDDLADVGTVIGEQAADLTHNALEFNLSLVGELDGRIDSESMATLLKRFSVKEGRRRSRLFRHSNMCKVLLPIFPW